MMETVQVYEMDFNPAVTELIARELFGNIMSENEKWGYKSMYRNGKYDINEIGRNM